MRKPGSIQSRVINSLHSTGLRWTPLRGGERITLAETTGHLKRGERGVTKYHMGTIYMTGKFQNILDIPITSV
jgi:hypothetical protein